MCKVYCHYVTCKNDSCEKHFPRNMVKETIDNVFKFGGRSPLFCIWQKEVNGITVNYRPECYKG